MAMAAATESGHGGAEGVLLSLETITERFSAPITEEHAFAVIHECMRSLARVLATAPASTASTAASMTSSGGGGGRARGGKARPLAVVAGTADIMLRRDGTVHGSTFVDAGASSPSGEESGKRASGMLAIFHQEVQWSLVTLYVADPDVTPEFWPLFVSGCQ